MTEYKNTSGKIATLTIITFCARLFGLLREILIANFYGASSYTDAYIIANNIPTVLFETLGSALLTCFIPMYSKVKNQINEQEANSFTQTLIRCLLIICIPIVLIGEIITRQIVWVFASGFQGETLTLTVQFTRILFPSLFAMTLVNILNGYLQVHDRFILPAMTTVIGNLAIIASLFIASYFKNIYIFVWGSLACICIQVLFVFPSAYRIGLYKTQQKDKRAYEYVRQMVPLVIPVAIGSAISEINSIVDRTMVSNLETGTVSALNYAFKVISLAVSVVIIPMVTIMYTRFSEASAKEDHDQYKMHLLNCYNMMLLVIIPVALYIFFFRTEIVTLLFMRGSFDSIAADRTIRALAFYVLGLIPIGIQNVMTRAYYSKQDTKTPTIIGAVCAILNAALNYIFIHQLGFVGAPLATAVVAFVNYVLLHITITRKKIIDSGTLIKIGVKNIIAGSALAAVLYLLKKTVLVTADTFTVVYYIKIFIFCIGTAIVYLAIQYMMKNNAVRDTLHKISKQRNS